MFVLTSTVTETILIMIKTKSDRLKETGRKQVVKVNGFVYAIATPRGFMTLNGYIQTKNKFSLVLFMWI